MSEEIEPCQCGGEAVDRGHGIECPRCGIWLGNGTTAMSLGGYVAAWNTRPERKWKWKYAQAPSFINSRGVEDLASIREIELIAAGFNAAREEA